MGRYKSYILPQNLTVDEAVELLNPDRIPRAYKYELRGAWKKIKDILLKKVKDKRKECHDWFDKLWIGHHERKKLYERLAKELNVPVERCHFSLLTEEQLDKSLHILKGWWREKYDK